MFDAKRKLAQAKAKEEEREKERQRKAEQDAIRRRQEEEENARKRAEEERRLEDLRKTNIINSLDQDVTYEIFSLLHDQDLVSAKQVCRYWYAACVSDPVLRARCCPSHLEYTELPKFSIEDSGTDPFSLEAV